MLGDRSQGEASTFEASLSEDEDNREEVVTCNVCLEQILESNSWRSEWEQIYCQEHAFDGTPTCCCCSRFKVPNIGFIKLNDGRELCPDCRLTAVLDDESFQYLVSEMHDFYGRKNMHIRKDIHALLVDQFEMNRRFQIPNQEILGVTISEPGTVICVNRSEQRGRNIEVVKRVEHLPHHCPVTGMLLLYGYPRLAIGLILAHEMMHTWMRLEGYNGLERKIEEGMCELMAYKWLEWYGYFGIDMYGANQYAQFMRNLKEYLKKEIEGNYCKIYGDGFREAKLAVDKYGFENTMIYIARTGKFPY